MTDYLLNVAIVIVSLVWVLVAVAILAILGFILDSHSTEDKW